MDIHAKKALSFAKLMNDGDDEGAFFLGPNRRYALVAPTYYGRQFTSSATCSPFSEGQKGHDHQAACGPSRLGAYAVRLCDFAHWRSCRWRDRSCGHPSPLVQRTSLLSLRLGMASSPLRGLVRKLISG
jgi:hypothetical protein